MSVPEPTQEELKELIPFCPCPICNQTLFETFLGFFTHGNCRMCHGCLQVSEFGVNFVKPAYIEQARKAKKKQTQENSDMQPTSGS